jgi:hypothetical protein
MNKQRLKKLRVLFEQSFGHAPNVSEFRLYKKVFIRNRHDVTSLNKAYEDCLTHYPPVTVHIPQFMETTAVASKEVINKVFKPMAYTKDIIAIIITIALVLSLFLPVNDITVKALLWAFGVVVGYYFGVRELPVVTTFKKRKAIKQASVK